MPSGRVASSAVEHPAFNRLVLSSNLRRPIKIIGNELETFMLKTLKMLFGLPKKQLLGWSLLATGVKVVFGIWLFGQLGWELPW